MNLREALQGARGGLELQRAAADEIARLDALLASHEVLLLEARNALFSDNPLSPVLEKLEAVVGADYD